MGSQLRTSGHKRSAKHGSSLVSWGPRNVPEMLDISHARAIARASADLLKAFHRWNFRGFTILWINSWCYYWFRKDHTGTLHSEIDAFQHASFTTIGRYLVQRYEKVCNKWKKVGEKFGIFGKRNKEMRELPNIIEFIPSSQPPALSLKVKKRCPRAPFWFIQLFTKYLAGAWCAKKRAPNMPLTCPPKQSLSECGFYFGYRRTVVCV